VVQVGYGVKIEERWMGKKDKGRITMAARHHCFDIISHGGTEMGGRGTGQEGILVEGDKDLSLGGSSGRARGGTRFSDVETRGD